MGTNRYDGIDEYAVSMICRKAFGLIGTAGFGRHDYPDLQQELAIQVIVNLERYNPTRGSKRAFINVVIDNNAKKLIEARRAQSRDYRCHICSTDDVFASRSLYEYAELGWDLERATKTCPSELKALLYSLMKHETIADVSRSSGIPRSTIFDRIKKLRTRLAKAGIGAYLQEGGNSNLPNVLRLKSGCERRDRLAAEAPR